MLLEIVNRKCPSCNQVLNPQKVHDGQSWWDKCQNQDCWVGYVSWELHEIEAKRNMMPPAEFPHILA